MSSTAFPRPCSWASGWKRRAGCRAPRWRARSRRCASASKKIDQHGVRRMRLVATEACRRARNARDFIRQVRRETGLQLEIIAPEEEARLAVISCAPLVSTRRPNSCWSSISAADRPNWSGSTCRPCRRAERPARDHAAARGLPAAGRRAPARVVDWISRAAWRGHAEGPVRRRRGRRRALCPDELVLRGKPGELLALQRREAARGVPDHRHHRHGDHGGGQSFLGLQPL